MCFTFLFSSLSNIWQFATSELHPISVSSSSACADSKVNVGKYLVQPPANQAMHDCNFFFPLILIMLFKLEKTITWQDHFVRFKHSLQITFFNLLKANGLLTCFLQCWIHGCQAHVEDIASATFHSYIHYWLLSTHQKLLLWHPWLSISSIILSFSVSLMDLSVLLHQVISPECVTTL